MDASTDSTHSLQRALAQLLRPLIRLLLRKGLSFGAFEEIAKKTFAEVALQDFSIPGKKPSISRASILSGLSRKEVQRLLATPTLLNTEAAPRHNRAARVLTGWIRDANFCDASGQPLVLQAQGPHSFETLVKRHSGDMPTRAVLDELVRVGAIQELENGQFELLVRAYVPQKGVTEKIDMLGTDVADLVATIDHNLQHGLEDPRFQRKVMYRNMSPDIVPAFRKLSANQGQALLEKLDLWLASQATDTPDEPTQPPGKSVAPKVRIGLGIYYFEEALDSTPHKGETP